MDVVRQRSGSQKELSSNKGFFFVIVFFSFFLLLKIHVVFFCNLSCFFFLFSIMNLYHKSHRFDFFCQFSSNKTFAVADREKKVKSGKTVNYFLFCSCIELFFSKSSTSMKLDIYLIIFIIINYNNNGTFRFPTFYM